jgi:hypothetical protein
MENSFSNIPSPFDNIPVGHPVVFISYSWDSPEHKAWVRKLSDDLRTKYAVYTLLDQYNRGGYDLISFMTKGVQKADRVLLIGTPEYRRKSDLYDNGGVKYEDQLITIELYHQMGSSKFIPILRKGKFDTSFTSIIETRTGYSMADDDKYDETLHSLAADLWNNPINAAPALGPKPSFSGVNADNNARPVQKVTVDSFVNEIKRYLSTPNSEIVFSEMIEDEGRRAHEMIIAKSDYNFRVDPAKFEEYKEYHLKAVEKLLASSILIVRFGTLKQQKLLVDVMVKLCMKRPLGNGESSIRGTSNLHLLGATFLFNTIGLACVKYGYYQILPEMMKRKVPAGHALSYNNPYTLAHLAGTPHWSRSELCGFMNQRWYYPYSELIYRTLRPYFKDYFLNDDEYRSGFAIWERLFSTMYVYYGSALIRDYELFPTGLFLGERILRNAMIGDDPYSQFFSTAETEKNDWEPLKQGLFDSSYVNFREINKRAVEYYMNNRITY